MSMVNSSILLTKEEILKLLKAQPPLLENLYDIEQQVQPNGIDLTIKEIASFESAGIIAPENSQRVLSETKQLPFDKTGSLWLSPGCYLVTCNEIINIPGNIMALAATRSSLLRCGVGVQTAVWDAGYSGRSQALMIIHNPQGFKIFQNARFIQLVFFHLGKQVPEGYKGIFQKENI
jgi:dUTP pyrophosphatase